MAEGNGQRKSATQLRQGLLHSLLGRGSCFDQLGDVGVAGGDDVGVLLLEDVEVDAALAVDAGVGLGLAFTINGYNSISMFIGDRSR